MSKTILIVDDAATMRQLAGFTLKDAGFEVIDAVNGKDALNKLAGKKVNLVVTDLNMPEMNGIELIKALRSKPETKFTPIIMLTTESDESIRKEGISAGAGAWIVKPFTPEDFTAIVKKYVK